MEGGIKLGFPGCVSQPHEVAWFLGSIFIGLSRFSRKKGYFGDLAGDGVLAGPSRRAVASRGVGVKEKLSSWGGRFEDVREFD